MVTNDHTEVAGGDRSRDACSTSAEDGGADEVALMVMRSHCHLSHVFSKTNKIVVEIVVKNILKMIK
jgi:hypothetical protein